MTKTSSLAALMALALAACVRPPLPDAPARGDFSADLIDLGAEPGPPPGPEGACWQADIRPAIIETVTSRCWSPRNLAEDGTPIPAVYATEVHQRIVEDRGTVWFRAPCPAEMTPDFVATVQRALKARGLYLLPLTGASMPPRATRSAATSGRAALTATTCRWPPRAIWGSSRPIWTCARVPGPARVGNARPECAPRMR